MGKFPCNFNTRLHTVGWSMPMTQAVNIHI